MTCSDCWSFSIIFSKKLDNIIGYTIMEPSIVGDCVILSSNISDAVFWVELNRLELVFNSLITTVPTSTLIGLVDLPHMYHD